MGLTKEDFIHRAETETVLSRRDAMAYPMIGAFRAMVDLASCNGAAKTLDDMRATLDAYDAAKAELGLY